MRYESVSCEIDRSVATISLLRPDFGSLSDLCDELLDLFLRLQDDNAVRAVLMIDSLQPFDMSPDIDSLAQAKCAGQGFEAMIGNVENPRRVVTLLQEFTKPIVAAATGLVRESGFGLFLAADCRLANSTATFCPPDMARGLLPDWGLTHTLPRLIGPSRALELLWSGRTLGAEEAVRIGLVDRMISAAVWEDEIDALLQRLVSLPQPSVRLSKLGSQQSGQFDMTSMLSFEHEAQEQCWDSVETGEGMAAYLDGRAPDFHLRLIRDDEDDE
jgi:enoyl-CoA hydratase/carnithine racemase